MAERMGGQRELMPAEPLARRGCGRVATHVVIGVSVVIVGIVGIGEIASNETVVGTAGIGDAVGAAAPAPSADRRAPAPREARAETASPWHPAGARRS